MQCSKAREYAPISNILLPPLSYTVSALLFFCNIKSFSVSWVLYIGNMLFAFMIAVFIITFNRKRGENAGVGKMILAGHITTVIGICICCGICLLMLLFVPGVYTASGAVLQKAPPQMASRGHEVMTTLIMNAILGNFFGGAFISVMLSATVKKDQKGETENKKLQDQ